MRTRVTLHVARVGTTPMNILKERLRKDLTNWQGRTLVAKARVGKPSAGHLASLPDQLRESSHINDHYCEKKSYREDYWPGARNL